MITNKKQIDLVYDIMKFYYDRDMSYIEVGTSDKSLLGNNYIYIYENKEEKSFTFMISLELLELYDSPIKYNDIEDQYKLFIKYKYLLDDSDNMYPLQKRFKEIFNDIRVYEILQTIV